jgi:hypothetical protein
MPPRIRLAVTVDVEEEGLFTGRYPREAAGVRNVASLRRVAFITRGFGLPLTLLTTYQVARDGAACRVLADWRDRLAAEIGAHLHPWNTPPFLPVPEPRRCQDLPRHLLEAKLATLQRTLTRAFGAPPGSFRMGRFDWSPELLTLLPDFGLRVDSSMVPLTQVIGGPDHFLAPPDPFRLDLPSGRASLVEAPLTMVPLLPRLPRAVYGVSRRLPLPLGHAGRAWFPFAAAAGIQPLWHPLPVMRLAALLHVRRGGGTLVMFFHSSELLPGGTPHLASEAKVRRLLGKIRAFLTWLTRRYQVAGITLSALAGDDRILSRPSFFLGGAGAHAIQWY